jgi:exonuclease SbcC
MRPLKLRMAGLRSYRTERTVDFTDLSLVAIIGPTGAGKSSLLEGITYSLYGASTWDKRAVKELISDAARSMRVSLEFEAEGKVWQVTRTISQNAGGSHELTCLSDPGVAKVDGDRSVNSRIEELVGLDYDGFCACVLLPQGKFEQLLKATKKDRASILKGILRLDELDLMRERATGLARRLTPRCEEILDARAQFLPDPALTEQQAASKQAELQPKREALENAKTTVDALIVRAGEHRRAASDADTAATRIDDLVDRGLMQRLQTLCERELRLAAEEGAAIASAAQAELDAAAAEQIVTGLRNKSMDSTAIKAVNSTLISAREDLTAIAEEGRQLAEEANQLSSDREAHESETARLAPLAAAVVERENAVSDRRAKLAAAEGVCEATIEQVRAIIAARDALQNARRYEQAARDDQAIKVVESTTASTNLQQARSAAGDARARLAEAQRANLVAELAHACLPGDACPVCARVLPDGFVAPVLPEDLKEHQAAVARADQAEHTAATAASTAQGATAIAERALADAVEQLAASSSIWQAQSTDALPDGLQHDTVELDETTLELLRAPRTLAKVQLEAAEQELLDGRSEHLRVQSTCEATIGELARRSEALATATEALERRRATVSARLRGLPEWIQLGEHPDDAAFAACAELVAARLGEAEEREAEATRAAHALAAAKETAQTIGTRMREEVSDPARVERTALTNLCSELARFDIGLSEAPADATPIAGLADWASAVIDAGSRELERFRQLSRSENEAAQAKTDQGRATVTAMGFDGSPALEQALIEILAEELAAKRDREQATLQLAPTAYLDGLLADARTLRDGLNELAGQLADAKFIGFVVERRQRALLTSASGILSQMTAGQFGFTEDFQIIDRRSDMARSPDTLSGGETFLASLALALGLVELAGRSGGRLQALFLDEGFGSLDPDALDQALNELEQRAHAGRLIALISHVPAVAERIDQILQVTKTPQGSDIQLLSEAERQALLLDDAAQAVITAQ